MDVRCLNLSKDFDTVSHRIPELMKYRLGKWTAKKMESWLNEWAWRFVISDLKSSWRQVIGSEP